MATLYIRPDIRERYPSLFGAKTANGRTLVVEDLIADMTVEVGAELPRLLADRHRFQEEVACGAARYDFLPGTEEVTDADGNRATAAAIRRGLLDGFFGRRTADAWRLNPTVRPQGPTTEDGLRYAMYMATEFMYQQLQGNNAAAIYDPRTGLRFMNDLARYEIFWHVLWLAVLRRVELTADGRLTPQRRRIKYGSRVLLSIVEARMEKALDAHDYVYDVPHATAPAA